MTSTEVQKALVGYGSNCLWSPQKVMAARNTVSVSQWESDLLIIHPSGWCWEIEIKVSVADFRREFKTKSGKHAAILRGHTVGYSGRLRPTIVRQFYFAMPVEVWEKVKGEIQEYAGVILLDDSRRDAWKRLRPWIEKKPKSLPARKCTETDRVNLLRSIYYRSWDKVEESAA